MSSRTQNADHDWFDDSLEQSQLKKRSVRGVLASLGGQFGHQGIKLASLIVLSRILTPDDFGLVAMITAIAGIGLVFQELGLSAATVRARNITPHQVSNLFWINLAAGTGVTLLVWMLADRIGYFYHRPDIAPAAMVMAISFIFGGATTQHLALLRRKMFFPTLAKISVLSALITALASLAGALADLGYWALIIGSLCGTMTSLAMAWSACNWRPTLPRRGAGTRPMAQFGLHLAVFSLLGFFGMNLHNLLIGRMWGASVAGLYSRSNAVRDLFVQTAEASFRYVVPSGLSRLAEQSTRYSDYYYKATTLLVMAFIPAVFVCLCLPSELIHVALGPQWEASAEILRLLSIGMLPQIISSTTGWVYLSAGDSARMMRWGLIGWSAIILATLVGAQFGIKGIAISASTVSLLLVVPALGYAFHGTPLKIFKVVQWIWRPAMAGITAALITLWTLAPIDIESQLARLICYSTLFVSLYALLLCTLFGQKNLIRDMYQQIRSPVISN